MTFYLLIQCEYIDLFTAFQGVSSILLCLYFRNLDEVSFSILHLRSYHHKSLLILECHGPGNSTDGSIKVFEFQVKGE